MGVIDNNKKGNNCFLNACFSHTQGPYCRMAPSTDSHPGLASGTRIRSREREGMGSEANSHPGLRGHYEKRHIIETKSFLMVQVGVDRRSCLEIVCRTHGCTNDRRLIYRYTTTASAPCLRKTSDVPGPIRTKMPGYYTLL